MKKTLYILAFLLIFVGPLRAQNTNNPNLDDIPVLNQGLKNDLLLDKRGKRYVTLEVLSLNYSDSSGICCTLDCQIRATIKGKKLKFGLYEQSYKLTDKGLTPESYSRIQSGITLQEGEEHIFDFQSYVKKEGPIILIIEYGGNDYYGYIGKELSFAKVPAYDNTEYFQKIQAKREALQREKEEAMRRARAKQDSLRSIVIERQSIFFTPEYLANSIGAGFFTKESIEAYYDVNPVAYNGGYVFYDFYKCPVTMEYDDRSHVCIEVSFRLYGEDGYQMKTDLIDYGYQLKSKSRGDLIAENNFYDLQTGTNSVYKKKLKNGGYSTCIITEGQAMMFTFMRTKN